jgi:hypothetical protein
MSYIALYILIYLSMIYMTLCVFITNRVAAGSEQALHTALARQQEAR